MNPRLRFALRAAVSLSLIGILAWKLREQGGAGITLESGLWLTAGACLVPLAVVLRVESFRMLINREERVLSFGQALHLTLMGSGAGLFLPGGMGDLLKAAIGARAHGSPEKFVAATVVDKLTSLATLGALGMLGAAVSGELTFGALALAALVVASTPLVAPSVVPWPLIVRTLAKSSADPETLRNEVRTPARTLVPVLAISSVGWVVTFTTILACCRAAGAPTGAIYIYAMAPLVSLSTLIPVSLAGLGLTQVTMALLLSRAGASTTEAISASFFLLLVGIAPGLVGIALYALRGGARQR